MREKTKGDGELNIRASPNPADVVSGLSSCVSSVLGCIAGSAIGTLSPDSTPEPLIQLAHAKKPQDTHATILSSKPKPAMPSKSHSLP